MLAKINPYKSLLVVIGIALLLRLIGFWHGFPFIFHPDEPALVRSAIGIGFDVNPKHFDWPHLHFYLNFIVYTVFTKGRAFIAELPFMEFTRQTVLWRDPIIFYMLSRIFNGILGALTVIPIYLAGKELGGKRAAVLAALFIAVFPFHVRVSHFALIDVPSVFWMSWGIYFSYKVLRSPSYKNYILAGLFFGLACSTKYNGLLGALSLVISHIILAVRSFDLKSFILKPLSALGACFGGFLIGTPFALFDYATFSRTDGPWGAYWQFTNVGSVAFSQRVQQFFTSSMRSVFFGTGISAMLLVLASIVDFGRNILYKKNVQNFLLTSLPAMFIIFYVSGFERTPSHYFLIAYPFIALGAGVYLAQLDFGKYIKYKNYVYAVIFALPAILSIHQVVVLSRTDTRVQAYNSINREVPKGSYVLYDSATLEPLKEKLKKEYKTKKVKEADKALQYDSAYWIVINDQFPSFDMAHFYSNNFNNGPDVRIYIIHK